MVFIADVFKPLRDSHMGARNKKKPDMAISTRHFDTVFFHFEVDWKKGGRGLSTPEWPNDSGNPARA